MLAIKAMIAQQLLRHLESAAAAAEGGGGGGGRPRPADDADKPAGPAPPQAGAVQVATVDSFQARCPERCAARCTLHPALVRCKATAPCMAPLRPSSSGGPALLLLRRVLRRT